MGLSALHSHLTCKLSSNTLFITQTVDARVWSSRRHTDSPLKFIHILLFLHKKIQLYLQVVKGKETFRKLNYMLECEPSSHRQLSGRIIQVFLKNLMGKCPKPCCRETPPLLDATACIFYCSHSFVGYSVCYSSEGELYWFFARCIVLVPSDHQNLFLLTLEF